jgi:hypothetical protein
LPMQIGQVDAARRVEALELSGMVLVLARR